MVYYCFLMPDGIYSAFISRLPLHAIHGVLSSGLLWLVLPYGKPQEAAQKVVRSLQDQYGLQHGSGLPPVWVQDLHPQLGLERRVLHL